MRRSVYISGLNRQSINKNKSNEKKTVPNKCRRTLIEKLVLLRVNYERIS